MSRSARLRRAALRLAAMFLGLGLVSGAVRGVLAQETPPRPAGAATEGKRSADPAAAASEPRDAPTAPPAMVVESISGALTVPLAGLKAPVLESESGQRLQLPAASLPLGDLLFLRFAPVPATPPPVEVVLDGGDALGGRVRDGSQEFVEIESPALAASVRVDIVRVRAILSRSGFASSAEWDAFRRRHVTRRPSSDVVFASSGGRFSGIVDVVAPDGVRFSSDNLGKVNFPFSKLKGVVFAELEDPNAKPAGSPVASPSPARPARTAAVVDFADGSSLSGELGGLDGDDLSLRHALLGDLRIRLSAVAEVSFRGGRCQFLSDWMPLRASEHLGAALTSDVAGLFTWKKDRNVLGEPMRMRGKPYRKGLGVHAFSRLEYELDGGFAQFQAQIGLDDAARPPPNASTVPAALGRVVFRVFADGKKLVDAALSHRDLPQPLDFDMHGVKLLVLEVDFGQSDLLFSRARANWAEARLVR